MYSGFDKLIVLLPILASDIVRTDKVLQAVRLWSVRSDQTFTVVPTAVIVSGAGTKT